jgi:hypothetical protein
MGEKARDRNAIVMPPLNGLNGAAMNEKSKEGRKGKKGSELNVESEPPIVQDAKALE